MRKPLAIDLFCGLGGWSEALLAEGYDCIGFDIERHAYGDHCYPGQLVLQDVLTLHGSQFRDADLIVASPPCQEYSYMAMPWKRAKAKAAAIRADTSGQALADLNRLFNACFRIQREACEASGRHIPMVVENVRGAQPWVGRAKWNYGSFYLWGDVPALMPPTFRALKNPGFRFDGSGKRFQSESVNRHTKNTGGSWFSVAHNTTSGKGNNPDGRKVKGLDWSQHGTEGYKPKGFNVAAAQRYRAEQGVKNKGDWFGSGENCSLQRKASSRSDSRKAASAMIAKIPGPLARHIARSFKPQREAA